MNKNDILLAVAEKTGFKKAEAEKIYDTFIETMLEAVKSGDKVSLAGFGIYEVKERAEKKGINPSTKQAIVIPASKALAFKPAKQLKDELNK